MNIHRMPTTTTFLIVILSALFSAPATAQSDQELVNRYDTMYAAQRYQAALSAAQSICARHPTAASWHFKAGALLAKLDQSEEAIEHLQTCADLKYSGIASFEHNSDLDLIREREDFKAILNTIRSNAKARMDEFQAQARMHKPKAYIPPKSTDDSKPPLVIALHGTGMTGQSMFNALQQACKNQRAILIAPDALRPAGDGYSWTYRDESEWFVNHLIEQAITEHNADPDRVILVGFSQGANIALNLGQTQPDTFQAVVPICGHYEPQNAETTDTPAPYYLIMGARDPWKKTYTQAKKDLTQAGAKVELNILPGRGHQLPTGSTGTRIYQHAIRWALEQDD